MPTLSDYLKVCWTQIESAALPHRPLYLMDNMNKSAYKIHFSDIIILTNFCGTFWMFDAVLRFNWQIPTLNNFFWVKSW